MIRKSMSISRSRDFGREKGARNKVSSGGKSVRRFGLRTLSKIYRDNVSEGV